MTEKLLLICGDCGTPFFTEGEKKFYEERKLNFPKRCKACRTARKKLIEQKRQEAEENRKIKYMMDVLPYSFCEIEGIAINSPEHTLYVIGNGFDLMHKVPSSYYDFRDSLGRRSELRKQLEEWNLEEDLWADFENNLAHMDDERMLESVPDMMELMGVLDEDDEDFSAADFFAAAEWCVHPLQVIQRELPKRFRKWVNTLEVKSEERPLISLLHANGTYINFNYTEFLETIYGIGRERILYIHGDRRNKNQELILGHAFEMKDAETGKRGGKVPFFNQTSYDLYATANGYVGDYYEATAKKSPEIIRRNKMYFDGLENINTVVVIGHSLSNVDYLYFREIIKRTNEAAWNIGWHSSGDLERIGKFVESMGIDAGKVRVFRT